jgi:hypothetical protein
MIADRKWIDAIVSLAVEKGDRHFTATSKYREIRPLAQSQSPFSTIC